MLAVNLVQTADMLHMAIVELKINVIADLLSLDFVELV